MHLVVSTERKLVMNNWICMQSASTIAPTIQSHSSPPFLPVPATDNCAVIVELLSAILIAKKDQYVTLVVSALGLKAVVESTSRTLQGSVFLPRAIFQTWRLHPEANRNDDDDHDDDDDGDGDGDGDDDAAPGHDGTIRLRVSLHILIECLNVFGATNGTTAVRLSYKRQGYPLEISLEEGGVITKCSIRTLENERLTGFNFRAFAICGKVIMASAALREAITELDGFDNNVRVAIGNMTLHLAALGSVGSCEVDFPADSESIETFECVEPVEQR